MGDLETLVQNTPLPKIGTSHGDFSWGLRNFGPEYPYTHPRLELLVEDFVSETGVWIKLVDFI